MNPLWLLENEGEIIILYKIGIAHQREDSNELQSSKTHFRVTIIIIILTNNNRVVNETRALIA